MDLNSIFLDKATQAIRIKSISTDPQYSESIKEMAEWCGNQLESLGFSTRIIGGYGNPIVLGSLVIDVSYPTVFHYGHYDVQPASKGEGWEVEPFELEQTYDKFIARGIVDNKGQFLIYLSAIQKLIEENSLGYNIKFFLEGNEETGSPKLHEFIEDYKNDLKADFALISDGEQINFQPSIDVTYRGTLNAELTVFGPRNSLHSGLYGGISANPANELVQILSKLTKGDGSTYLLKGSLRDADPKDIQNMKSNQFNFEEYTSITGFEKPLKETAFDIYNTLGFTNTIQITGINSGYLGEGFRNAIPTKASAKLNVRFSPVLDMNDACKALEDMVLAAVPEGIKYEFEVKDKSPGVKIDTSDKIFSKAVTILKDIYGKEILYNYCGATLPIAYYMSKGLGIPTIFTGLANADCNMHGVAENFSKDLVDKGLRFVYSFLKKA